MTFKQITIDALKCSRNTKYKCKESLPFMSFSNFYPEEVPNFHSGTNFLGQII